MDTGPDGDLELVLQAVVNCLNSDPLKQQQAHSTAEPPLQPKTQISSTCCYK